MVTLTRGLAACILAFAFTGALSAQTSEPTDEQLKRAQITFTRLLNSEQRANRHVLLVALFSQRTPYKFATVIDVTQRLVVNGFVVEDLGASLMPCADMAAALNAEPDEDRFVKLVAAIAGLGATDKRPDATITFLEMLESENVPVYEMLARATGTTSSRMRATANASRLRGSVARRLLLEEWQRRFGGLAAKLHEENAARK